MKQYSSPEYVTGETSGVNRSPEYASWANMMTRCYNPRRSESHRYGGRGIIVCEEWHQYRNFLRDMGRMSDPHLTLDRIDVDGNYCKDNCRWISRAENSSRVKKGNKISAFGVEKTLRQFMEEGYTPYPFEINSIRAYYCRLIRGWTIEEALSTPIKSRTKKE